MLRFWLLSFCPSIRSNRSFSLLFFRLAAIALLYLEQEDAFWSLIAIVEVFMPRDYYTKTLLGSQVNKVMPEQRRTEGKESTRLQRM